SKPTKPILIAPFWMVFKDTLQEQYAIVNNKNWRNLYAGKFLHCDLLFYIQRSPPYQRQREPAGSGQPDLLASLHSPL
ncbi:hypothetical protein ED971_20790, partial [Salmonella enterica]|nr:hypothetical protein [Salmonella enterica]